MSADASTDPSRGDSVYLITGFPGDLAKRAIAKVAASGARGFVLASAADSKDAQRSVARAKAHLDVLSGEVEDMHLGLSGLEYERVCDTVTDIFHLVAPSYLTSSRRAQADGTRNILSLIHI